MQVYLIQLFSPKKDSFTRFFILIALHTIFIWDYYEHTKTVVLTFSALKHFLPQKSIY